MIDGDLPDGFQDGFATVRKTLRNGNVKTNETGKLSNVEETDTCTGFTVFRRAQDPFDRVRAMDLELDLEPLRSFIAQRIVEAEGAVQSGKTSERPHQRFELLSGRSTKASTLQFPCGERSFKIYWMRATKLFRQSGLKQTNMNT